MHEYYVTEEIVRIACEVAAEHQAKEIQGIVLVIGERSGIVPDSIQFYFEALAKGTIAEGASLTTRWQPVERRCPACQVQYEEAKTRTCPQCGILGDIVSDGSQFYMDSIELPD